MKIKFSELIPNNYNPRELFRGAAMEELKASIEQLGLIEPLVVRKLNGKYEVVAGMRRYYALKDLKIDDVECNVLELTNPKAKLVSLVENIQRDNLSAMEEARAYAINLNLNFEKSKDFSTLFDEKKYIKGIGDFATKIGKSHTTVHSRLRLLTLPEDIQSVVHLRKIQLQIAEGIAELGKIKDLEIAQKYMLDMFKDYKEEGFSVKELERRVKSKIDFEKNKETEAGKLIEKRIQQLNKSIKETNEAYDKEMVKLIELAKTVSEKEGLDIAEDCQIEDADDVETEKTDNLLKFLEEESEKYKDDAEYEEIANEINKLESAISDIRLLSNRTKTQNLRICPYCHAGIDLKTIEKKENIYQENLDEQKKKREQIAGMRGFLVEMKTKIQRQVNSLNKKYEFIEGYETELKKLENPELEIEE